MIKFEIVYKDSPGYVVDNVFNIEDYDNFIFTQTPETKLQRRRLFTGKLTISRANNKDVYDYIDALNYYETVFFVVYRYKNEHRETYSQFYAYKNQMEKDVESCVYTIANNFEYDLFFRLYSFKDKPVKLVYSDSEQITHKLKSRTLIKFVNEITETPCKLIATSTINNQWIIGFEHIDKLPAGHRLYTDAEIIMWVTNPMNFFAITTAWQNNPYGDGYIRHPSVSGITCNVTTSWIGLEFIGNWSGTDYYYNPNQDFRAYDVTCRAVKFHNAVRKWFEYYFYDADYTVFLSDLLSYYSNSRIFITTDDLINSRSYSFDVINFTFEDILNCFKAFNYDFYLDYLDPVIVGQQAYEQAFQFHAAKYKTLIEYLADQDITGSELYDELRESYDEISMKRKFTFKSPSQKSFKPRVLNLSQYNVQKEIKEISLPVDVDIEGCIFDNKNGGNLYLMYVDSSTGSNICNWGLTTIGEWVVNEQLEMKLMITNFHLFELEASYYSINASGYGGDSTISGNIDEASRGKIKKLQTIKVPMCWGDFELKNPKIKTRWGSGYITNIEEKVSELMYYIEIVV